ncbi:MAG: DNA polymerase III subunit chi [Gammaproteobacteria bacterium]|nr:MAG: DNA polymerase III subunit chi [Gammaproteobacteria bacterium]
MTKIDFYVVSPNNRGNRYQLACRVADKAYRQGHRVVIHVSTEDEARHLDRLLWTFNEQSFVPHARIGKGDATINPVLIGDVQTAEEEHDVLINLAPEVPLCFARFQRLAECVDNEPGIREASRERYRFYRDRGYPLALHEIG